MSKKIVMSDYRVVAKSFDKRMAGQDGLPLWLRIVHAAGAEMNRSGHAFFGGWQNLADYVKIDGKPMPLRAKVYEGVKKAIELGYLSPDSDVDCLVFRSADTQKAARSGYGCKNPKHADKCRTAVEIAEAVAEAYESEEQPAFDPETGEVLEEAVEASESVQDVSEDTEPAVEAPVAVESPVEASEELPAVSLEEDAEEPTYDIDWGVEVEENEKVNEPTKDEFFEWFGTLSESEQEVAFFGFEYRRRDSLGKIVLVTEESRKSEYDMWTTPNMKYAYAADNVSYQGPAREDRQLVKVSDNPLMNEEW